MSTTDHGVLRLKMQNGNGGVLKAAKHNKRCLPSHVGCDPARSHLNYALRGPAAPGEVATLAKRLMSEAGIHKLKRKDSITAIEVISSLPVGSTIGVEDYFAGFVEFIERRFGSGNILSADVHLDEPAAHCHVLILPLDGNKLDASGIVGGPSQVNELHAAFYAEFASSYGLSRPPPKLSGAAKKIAAKMVIDRLVEDSDASLVSGAWPAIQDAIERYPEPFLASLGIERPAPVRPGKTFAQIATSAGAGPKTAAAEASRDRRLTRLTTTPLGVDGSSESRPLPCVGVAQSAGFFSSFTDHPQSGAADTREAPGAHSPHSAGPTDPPGLPEYTRQRDADLDPADFDHERGEYIKRLVQTRSGKAAARDWVEGGLLAQPGAAAPGVAR